MQYGKSGPQPSFIETTVLTTSFTTPGHLQLGTKYIFKVRAYTRVGGGEETILEVSTLTKPCEK